MRVLSDEERAAKLKRLCEIEGFEDEAGLFAATISDRVCPAIAGILRHLRYNAD